MAWISYENGTGKAPTGSTIAYQITGNTVVLTLTLLPGKSH